MVDGSRADIPPTEEFADDELAAKVARAREITPLSWRPPHQLGEYELRGTIGRGGMGQVYLYWDTRLERAVAIKFVESLDEEGKAAAQFHHSNVAAVYRVGDIGEDRATDARSFIASEYIDGDNVARLTPIGSRRRVIQIARDLARGLSAAHDAGVVHGDIKPSNAMVDRATGTAKLIDFGLARRTAMPARAPTDTDGGEVDGEARKERLGTAPYAAPELWVRAPTSPRSDVYAFGAMLYEMCTGTPPPSAARTREVAAGLELAEVEQRFGVALADIARKCLRADPDQRYAGAGEVLAALDALDGSEAIWSGNPYRGLLPFEREHRSLFFGRDMDIWPVVEAMRRDRMVVLAGESGVGKSSLARAGVLPQLAETGVGSDGFRMFEICTLVPGARPLAALTRALAERLGLVDELDQSAIEQPVRTAITSDPITLRRLIRERHGRTRGTVLFVDQLEELVTLAKPEEAALVASALGALIAERTPGLRILATARMDHVAGLAHLPGLGELIPRRLYLVTPLGPRATREVITRPAHAAGGRFASEDIVAELVGSVSGAEGGLPLLQFALAQLWEASDDHVISRDTLTEIGGVEGALARHADAVLAAMLPAMRRAARRVLIDLVTERGTRARPRRADVERGDPARRGALEALIRGRLAVTGEVDGEPTCTIAHEALLTVWPTLAGWLEDAGTTRALTHRLSRAAEAWDGAGRPGDALWGRRSLATVRELDEAQLTELSRAFLANSRRAVTRSRLRLVLAIGAPLVAAAIALGAIRFAQERALDARIRERVVAAERELATARKARDAFQAERRTVDATIEAIPHADVPGALVAAAEEAWERALDHAPVADAAYLAASRQLERAFGLDPERAAIRTALADVLDAQAVFAEERYLRGERDMFTARLALYAPALAAAWTGSVPVRITSDPPGARVDIASVTKLGEGRQDAPVARGTTPFTVALAPGSFSLAFDAGPDHVTVRYPLYVRPRRVLDDGARDGDGATDGAAGRATTLAVDVSLPPSDSKPARLGLVYVPAGSFLFGYGTSTREEPQRRYFETLPLHERHTPAFWISPYEATFADWIAFLDACGGGACDGLEPAIPGTGENNVGSRIALARSRGDWALTLAPGAAKPYTARRGEPFVYTAREGARREQDWLAFPVIAVSRHAVEDYLAWLRGSGNLPGARLCREDEWERAARGADGRLYPHGDELAPDEANFDRTYGRVLDALGPDAVGSHPKSDSPFGLHDMSGNAFEMVVDPFAEGASRAEPPRLTRIRGGSNFHQDQVASSVNRWVVQSNQPIMEIGFRVCADAN